MLRYYFKFIIEIIFLTAAADLRLSGTGLNPFIFRESFAVVDKARKDSRNFPHTGASIPLLVNHRVRAFVTGALRPIT